MISTVNFALEQSILESHGGIRSLRRKLEQLGLDGVEGIWAGTGIPSDFSEDVVKGYHLTFFPEWLDFYRGDMEKVYAHFGNDDNVRLAFGSTDPSVILKTFQEDLARALSFHPAYVVFHVTDVSMEENFTYRWLHSDEEIIDASIEMINELLKKARPTFDFLVENQWWPGFTFTDPALTERLLNGIRYPKKGILLDTGHLMNANPKIRNQKQGIAFIREMLHRHGSLTENIKGMHFHQSANGQYARNHTGSVPADFPPVSDYLGQLSATYSHILKIDRHLPWTEPGCIELIDRIRPDYLTHEMSGSGNPRTFSLAKRQIRTLQRSEVLKSGCRSAF